MYRTRYFAEMCRKLRAWFATVRILLIGQSTPLIIRLIDCFIVITYKKVMQFRDLVSVIKLVSKLANM